MLIDNSPWPADIRLRTHLFMQNFRVAVLATIAFLALLISLVGTAAAIFNVSDRGMTIISVVITGLLSLLPTVIVYLKADAIEFKVDTAAGNAETARLAAARAEQKIDAVHTDVLNGPLRENVKQAVREVERDPAVQAIRIETTARGVQRDRHDKANRLAGESGRAQIEEIKRRRGEESTP